MPVFCAGVLTPCTQGLHEDLPSGGNWTCLYSSRDHGFSMNRFQHHCFDYKQPSVMIIDCNAGRDGKHFSFALAMDSEWRQVYCRC